MNNCQITQRQIVLEAMKTRSLDPWPRGIGHVPLGEPGSPRSQKAYHEPGGSFSTSAGSFGVSVWITDSNGKRIATSDDIPLDDIGQHYAWPKNAGVPALETKTPYYHCTWSLEPDDRWRWAKKRKQNVFLIQPKISSALMCSNLTNRST